MPLKDRGSDSRHYPPARRDWFLPEMDYQRSRVGTLANPHGAMAALLSEIENGGMATPPWPTFRTPTLGVPGITVGRFYDLAKSLREHRPNPSVGEPGRGHI